MSDRNKLSKVTSSTKKEITSKINTGVTKKPSILTIVAPRQISRPPSRQNTFSVRGNKPNDKSSTSSGGASSKSQLGLPNDKTQRLHKPGSIPSYLRSTGRPATVHSCLKPSQEAAIAGPGKKIISRSSSQKILSLEEKQFRAFQKDFDCQLQKYTHSKEVLASDSKDQKQSELSCDLVQAAAKLCSDQTQQQVADEPPCEGTGESTAHELALRSRENELKTLRERATQLEDKCKTLEVDCRKQMERAFDLECELKARDALIQEREQTLEQLKKLAQQELPEDKEQILEDLRVELSEKSGTLIHNQSILVNLQKKLADVEAAREQEETRVFELQEKLTETEMEYLEEKTRLEQCNQERALKIGKLHTQVTTMLREIEKKNGIIANLKAYGAVELPQQVLKDSPEAQWGKKVEVLQAEVQSLRTELKLLEDAKRQNDVLLEIRTKLMENLEADNEKFKKRCEKFCESEGEDEADSGKRNRFDGFEMLCDTVADRQRKCCAEEKIISEIDQNNRKCRAVRQKMLGMLKQLQKENRKMKEAISKSGPNLVEECAKNESCSQLGEKIFKQIRELFPAETVLPDDEQKEEKISNRINYEIETEQVASQVQSVG
ncbi:girdin-like [Wyeomyia smithii]|uniref:girdin-like n=1 Tax=Wyeomyia smithii TaxID=174621 RepID=UPI0024680826|nr:girdin-like [Wyeomyia smithii]